MSHLHPHLLAFVLLLALTLSACGDNDALTGGGDSPRDVVTRMAGVSQSGSMEDFVPLLLPEQRASLTYMIGIMGPTMMIGLGESIGAIGNEVGGDDAGATEHVAKIKAMKAEWNTVLTKHGVTLPAEDDDSVMMGADDPAAEAAKFDKLLGDIDHRAFLKDALAFMAKHSDKDKPKSSGGIPKFSADDATITEDGDSATVTVAGQPSPLQLVKKSGRWFVDMASLR